MQSKLFSQNAISSAILGFTLNFTFWTFPLQSYLSTAPKLNFKNISNMPVMHVDNVNGLFSFHLCRYAWCGFGNAFLCRHWDKDESAGVFTPWKDIWNICLNTLSLSTTGCWLDLMLRCTYSPCGVSVFLSVKELPGCDKTSVEETFFWSLC